MLRSVSCPNLSVYIRDHEVKIGRVTRSRGWYLRTESGYAHVWTWGMEDDETDWTSSEEDYDTFPSEECSEPMPSSPTNDPNECGSDESDEEDDEIHELEREIMLFSVESSDDFIFTE